MRKFIGIILSIVMICALVGCGSTSNENLKNDVSVNDVVTELENNIEFNKNENFTDAEKLKNEYYINPDDVEEFVIKQPVMNVKANELAIIKVKDESKMEEVKKGLEKRGEDLDNKWKQYLPDQYKIVQDRRFVNIGNYAIFVVDEEADKIIDSIKNILKG